MKRYLLALALLLAPLGAFAHDTECVTPQFIAEEALATGRGAQEVQIESEDPNFIFSWQDYNSYQLPPGVDFSKQTALYRITDVMLGNLLIVPTDKNGCALGWAHTDEGAHGVLAQLFFSESSWEAVKAQIYELVRRSKI